MKKTNLKYDIEESQEIDLNLYHLWLSLQELEFCRYSDDIKKKINDLILYVDKKLFKRKVDFSYDIVGDKCVLTTYYEKFKKKHN